MKTNFRAAGATAIIAALFGFGGAGCAETTPVEKAQANLATMQKEHSSDRLLERGRIFASIGDLTRAEEYLAAALHEGADARTVMPLLVRVCIQDGRYRAAAHYAEEHLQKNPDDLATRFVVGTIYVALGESKAAHENLELVIEKQPNEAQAHYALGVLSRDTDADVIATDRHFREYLRLQPKGKHADEARASLLKRVK